MLELDSFEVEALKETLLKRLEDLDEQIRCTSDNTLKLFLNESLDKNLTILKKVKELQAQL